MARWHAQPAIPFQKAVCALTAPVTVLIPVWNRADLLGKLLDTIASQTARPEKVIVIDNGSTDDAPAVAERWGARVIAMGGNRGFAAAVNRGIEESTAEWVAVINSDVELEPGWFGELLRAASETGAWFACGKILSARNPALLDGVWDLVAKSGCAWRAGSGRPDSAFFAERRTISMCSATATLYRRDLFRQAGSFAEIYGSYLEDVDFSLRCCAGGWQGVYEPGAVCKHQGSASAGSWSVEVTYRIARNQRLLVDRLFSRDMQRAWRWKISAGQLLWGLVALRHGQPAAWLRGRSDARRMTQPEPLHSPRLRAAIEKSEREIFALQRQFGMDWYWRLYFLITGTASQ